MAECLREKKTKHTYKKVICVHIYSSAFIPLQLQNLKTLEFLKEGILTTSQVISKSLNWGEGAGRKVLIIKHRVEENCSTSSF